MERVERLADLTKADHRVPDSWDETRRHYYLFCRDGGKRDMFDAALNRLMYHRAARVLLHKAEEGGVGDELVEDLEALIAHRRARHSRSLTQG